jgi:DNA-binding response OmpR family regulator
LAGTAILLFEEETSALASLEALLLAAGARVLLAESIYQLELIARCSPLDIAIADAEIACDTLERVRSILGRQNVMAKVYRVVAQPLGTGATPAPYLSEDRW